MKKVIRLTESDLVNIVNKILSEGVTQKITDHNLSSWLSFKLGPKVLSGNFVSDGSWVTFNGKRYSKPVFNGNQKGSGTWTLLADKITFNFS